MSTRTPRVSALHLSPDATGSLRTERRAADVLAEEVLTLRLDGHRSFSLPRTPGHDVELAHGFLYAQGLIHSAAQVREARYCAGAQGPDGCNSYNVLDLRSTRPLPGAPDAPAPAAPEAAETAAIAEPALRALLRLLPALPSTGMHRATILAPEHEGAPRLPLSREDAHAVNALDKAVGALLLQRRVPATGLHLVLASPPTLDLVRRAARAGLSGVFSPAPPTAAAVEHARACGLLLARASETPARRPVVFYSGVLSDRE
ncbi:formate dehydrogenase accessory sulfurtransferase FdhD [Corynebacterium mastitidis]|uniref:Formate dehydrogenase accessory sulfurtransferase FdhD n=1 Tax=Corynebacterium mastitidis TaxID=161890 RepID=A0ABU8NZT8_9CORY